MTKRIAMILTMSILGTNLALAQDAAAFKGFQLFKGLVTGVDFFASNRQEVKAFEKPTLEARQRFAELLGKDIPSGAIFVCSTLQQKDAVYEPRALKMGYKWLVVALTANARMEEMMARMKAQMGGEIPPEMLDRIKSRMGDNRGAEGSAMENAIVRPAIRQMGFAMIQAVFGSDREFRVSRIEDVRRSSLPDWLDIGIANYVAGESGNLGFVQQRIDEAFPLEDVVVMSRPFVASSQGEGGFGGGGFVMRQGGPPAGGMPAGGPPRGMSAGGAQGRSGGSRQIPKDQLDRMLFDGEASALFQYLLEKTGPAKVRELIHESPGAADPRKLIAREDLLGTDLLQAESQWFDWVKAQKVEEPADMFRGRP